MEKEAIRFAKWMRENGVSIITDEISDYAFDIGVNSFSAETLYNKFISENLIKQI